MTSVSVDPELTLYSLQRPDVIASPWSFYARLRAEAPVHFDPYMCCWLLSRHADVTAMLTDPRFSVQMQHEERLSRLTPSPPSIARAMRYLDRHVSFIDPPRHTQVRKVLAAPFQPRHVRLFEGYVQRAVDGALERLERSEHPDVVRDLATRVPLQVIRRMLGLDETSLATVRRWSTAWGDVVAAPGHIPTGDRERVLAVVDELVGQLHELVARHRRDGRADTVTGVLVRATDAGELTEDELIANLMMLVTAGNETTGNLIGNAVSALLDEPALWARLRGDRSLLPLAVEELARVFPPTQYTARIAREDVEIGGHVIRRGQAAVLLLGAANRDPEVFDEPDEIRLDRENARRHVAFGRGPHFCFGAPLARLETWLALDGLLDGAELRRAGPQTWRLNANLRGLESLAVEWMRGSAAHVPGEA